MTKTEIIASLKDQAKDKDILANGEKDSIFTRDAQALREAAEMLEKSKLVVHGRWERLTGMMPPEYQGKRCCSICGKLATEWKGHELLTDYCPNCGAKMDGGANA